MKDDEVARDMASPDWLMWPPFVCFRAESVSKNKPICDCSGLKSTNVPGGNTFTCRAPDRDCYVLKLSGKVYFPFGER